MSKDNEFGIIQIENLWDDSYDSPGILEVWLLMKKYIKNLIQSHYIYNIIGRKTRYFAIIHLFQRATISQSVSSNSGNNMDR